MTERRWRSGTNVEEELNITCEQGWKNKNLHRTQTPGKRGKIVSRQDQTHLHQQAVKEKCKFNKNFSGLKDMQLFFTEAVLMLKPLLIVALLHEISTCCQQISLKKNWTPVLQRTARNHQHVNLWKSELVLSKGRTGAALGHATLLRAITCKNMPAVTKVDFFYRQKVQQTFQFQQIYISEMISWFRL